MRGISGNEINSNQLINTLEIMSNNTNIRGIDINTPTIAIDKPIVSDNL
ncbi:hypothetical protein [Metamycoplasma hominis]|nr:hypothetical protein [Metamycoplasma hominis]